MKDFFHLCGRTIIAVFFVWHATAIGVYALPWVATDTVTTSIKKSVGPYVHPYVLWTSQWQQWNLFSPDPLRRVSQYTIHEKRGDEWVRIETIRPGTYSIWRHAARFKIMSAILESDEPSEAFVQNFLRRYCLEKGLAPDATVKVTYQTYILPKPDEPHSLTWWWYWEPIVNSYEGFSADCTDRTGLANDPS
jgi:hypothetical protein